jgi:hypothetical protein
VLQEDTKASTSERQFQERLDRFDRRFGVLQTLLSLAFIVVVVVVLPIEGHISLWSGLAVLGGLLIIYVLAYAPRLVRGYESFFGIVAGFVAFALSPRHITHLAFYSTVAEILPVLFVALAFQSRTFWIRDEMDETSRRTAIIVGAALVFAGRECLAVLASGNAAKGDAQLVVTALVGSVTALVLSAVAGPEQPTPKKPPTVALAPGAQTPASALLVRITVAATVAVAAWTAARRSGRERDA